MTTVHTESSPFAGKLVTIKEGTVDPAQDLVVGGAIYRVEDWWDLLTGKTWAESEGNFAAMHYGFRLGANGLPMDNEVVYGKIGNLGHIVHVSEIDAVYVPPSRTFTNQPAEDVADTPEADTDSEVSEAAAA